MEAIIGLTWFSSLILGAFWTSALEREEHERARIYGRAMVFCFLLLILEVVLSSGL